MLTGEHDERSEKKNPLKHFDCEAQSRGFIHAGRVNGQRVYRHIDEFRAKAKECRQLASLAPKDDDKAFWLRPAEDWLRLLGLVQNRR